MIRSYYRCCCMNTPVIFSHCVHLKLGHRFHALLKVCSDCDDTVLLKTYLIALSPTDRFKGPIKMKFYVL